MLFEDAFKEALSGLAITEGLQKHIDHFARCAKLHEPGSPNTTRNDHTIAWRKYRLPCSDGGSKTPETLLLKCVIDGQAYEPTKQKVLYSVLNH